MNDDLYVLLDQYDDRLKKAAELKVQEVIASRNFGDEFVTVRERTIMPVLERLKTVIEKHGHVVRIATREPSSERRVIALSVTFAVELKGRDTSKACPVY